MVCHQKHANKTPLFYFILFDCNLCIADDHSDDADTMQPKTVRATRAILFDNPLRTINEIFFSFIFLSFQNDEI